MAAFADKLIWLVNSARPVIIGLVIFSLMVCGGMMIYPSERSKQAAKDSLPFVVIGSAIALGAVAIGKALTSGF